MVCHRMTSQLVFIFAGTLLRSSEKLEKNSPAAEVWMLRCTKFVYFICVTKILIAMYIYDINLQIFTFYK